MQRILVAALVALSPGAGVACTQLAPFEMKQIGGADLVFVAEVTAYQDLGTPAGAALVTVEVEEALKGRARGEIVLIWNGGMAMAAQEARAMGRVLIGAKRGGRIAVSDMVPDLRPDLPAIIQPNCGEVWMRPATDETIAAANAALK